MKNTLLYSFSFVLLFTFQTVMSQVGIGTTTPNAALEIKSATAGFLPPRVALTATNVQAPVVNPQGGNLLAGTMVYNTGNTMPSVRGVSPGLYFWNGTEWVSQYQRRFNRSYKQTSSKTYTTGGGYSTINGLSGLSFTAPYNGVYQFIFNGYLGTTEISDRETNIPAAEDISGYAAVGFVEGFFRLTIAGGSYEKYNYSTSFYRSDTGLDGSGGTDIFQLMNEVTFVVNVTLTAGQSCNFNAAYNPLGDDNVPAINSHIVGETAANSGNLCELNVTYLGRD